MFSYNIGDILGKYLPEIYQINSNKRQH